MQLRHPRLEEALALLGRLVFRVLAEVPMLARPEDLLGQVHPELVVELLDLVLKPLLEIDHLSSEAPAPAEANIR